MPDTGLDLSVPSSRTKNLETSQSPSPRFPVPSPQYQHPPMSHEELMQLALQEAARGKAAGEVPIGAVVVHDGVVVGRGFNQPIGAGDPTAHAEIVAIR